MRVDLSSYQLARHREQGKITSPEGVGYSRQTTKTARRKADDLVAEGVPLVLDLYGSGQFEWFDGDDALQIWAECRAYVITTEATARQLAKHAMWNAGIWASDDDRRLLYLTGRC